MVKSAAVTLIPCRHFP